jgi:formylglycine-generating enzyme required for sulfatase activity
MHEVTVGQFRAFVEATQFNSAAETDGIASRGADLQTRAVETREDTFTWRDPGFVQSDDHPVSVLSRNDAEAFLHWLSRTDGRAYRLPTEAEWEFACRAGTTTLYYCGNDPAGLEKVANSADASFIAALGNSQWAALASPWDDGHPFTAPVGSLRANAFGLHDMHGNVQEWSADWYDEAYFQRSPRRDPTGPASGKFASLRSGVWNASPWIFPSASRGPCDPRNHNAYIGFRLACEIPTDAAELGKFVAATDRSSADVARPMRPPRESPSETAAPAQPQPTGPRVELLDELNLANCDDTACWLSADGLTIYWCREGAGAEKPGIWQATRKQVDGDFQHPRWILDARHAALARNGLLTVCVGRSTGPVTPILSANRRTVDGPFPEPTPIAVLVDQPTPKSPWISEDGLTLVFQRALGGGKTEFAVTTRRVLGGRWSPPQTLSMRPDPRLDDQPPTWPHLSDDGLELWFTNGPGKAVCDIVRATRPSPQEPFGNYQFIEVDGKRLAGRSPRYRPATQELFYAALAPRGESNWDLAVVRDLDLDAQP